MAAGEYAASERRVCGLLTMAVASYCYRAVRVGSDERLRVQLVELSREQPRFGYRRLHVLLRRSGERVNHKRVYRLYREAGLTLKRKKRKHCVRAGKPLVARTSANQEWGAGFCARRGGVRACDPGVERGGRVYTRVFGAGWTKSVSKSNFSLGSSRSR
ncbi:MAG TPA: IS3 family transposase [Candidatus Sulfotelmatobacter sp.]